MSISVPAHREARRRRERVVVVVQLLARDEQRRSASRFVDAVVASRSCGSPSRAHRPLMHAAGEDGMFATSCDHSMMPGTPNSTRSSSDSRRPRGSSSAGGRTRLFSASRSGRRFARLLERLGRGLDGLVLRLRAALSSGRTAEGCAGSPSFSQCGVVLAMHRTHSPVDAPVLSHSQKRQMCRTARMQIDGAVRLIAVEARSMAAIIVACIQSSVDDHASQ